MKNHKACIIGAGSSGITTARMLQKNNIQFDWYEMSDNIGGNWYYKNPNGMSSCYQSLHIDTSKTILQFEEFPLPDNAPDYYITATFTNILINMSITAILENALHLIPRS